MRHVVMITQQRVAKPEATSTAAEKESEINADGPDRLNKTSVLEKVHLLPMFLSIS